MKNIEALSEVIMLVNEEKANLKQAQQELNTCVKDQQKYEKDQQLCELLKKKKAQMDQACKLEGNIIAFLHEKHDCLMKKQ